MRTSLPLRTIVVSAVLFLLATPSAVHAAFTSVLASNTATMTGDAAGDVLSITSDGTNFRHNRFALGDPGFASEFDFDTAVAGEQPLPASTGVINVNAGDGNDTIAVGDFLLLKGTVDGGPGTDTLDYSAYAVQGAHVNLGLGTNGLNATLGGNQEVPPTTHAATGTAAVTNYNIMTRTFDISVAVSGLAPADVSGFHIHFGWPTTSGFIFVDFTGVAPLVPSGDGFTFNATALTFSENMEAAFLGGASYVNIHTAAFPNGAIRGQLFSAGNVSVSSGRAFGLASVTGVENVVGGASADSLVGSFQANTIGGGTGSDHILGGPGNDTLNGGAGEELIIWNNGDGSDVIDGAADFDIVQVNGNPSADDTFTVSPNGTRIDFDRISPGPFSLDIGTTESLIVSGIGGADTMTVDDLGAAELTRLELLGFEGNDLFTFVPVSAGGRTITVHGGAGDDTVQGPDGTAVWTASGPNFGSIGGVVFPLQFIETLNGGSGSDTFHVKAFASGTVAVSGGGGDDTLIYDAETRAVSGDLSPPDGTINSPGVQSLPFTQIESIFLSNAPNTTPAITPVADQTIAVNSNTGALPFTVFDVESSAASLVVTGSSSNPTLVPATEVHIGGSGASRTVTVTPAANQVGTATITLTVTDEGGVSASTAFLLTVVGPTTVQPPTFLYVAAMSGNTVTFRFTPAPVGPPATGFVLEGGVSPGQVLASIPTGSAVPIYSVVAPNGSFYVRMHATRGAEKSSASNEIQIHVNVPVAPTAPDGLSRVVNGSTVALGWRNTLEGGAPSSLVLDVTGSATTSIPLGVSESLVVGGAPGGTYTLRLRSLNAGGASPPSNPVTVTIPSSCTGPPGVPSEFLAYRIGSTVNVVWEPPFTGTGGVSSYVLNVTGSFVGSIPASARSLSGAVGPGSYTVSVAAVNPCGTSAYTAPQTVVVP